MSQMCPKCSADNTTEAQICIQCAMPLRNLLGENTVLSQRYKLVSVLGCGAMGAVYLAKDQRLVGRRCAIKENRPDPTAPVNVQEQSREQFLAEASVLARLDHPSLPKVSDYYIEAGREYLVMDYVEGEDLESQLIRTEQPLDEAYVIGWADQILDALAYLHNQKPQPIIHRDIKPANLRVDLYNRVKLVDFGLVKLFDADNPETKAELRGVGTPAYAPLEQFAGREEHTDARSDIYSLGATLYHLLTNAPPVEVHQRLLKREELSKLRARNPGISKKTEDVILKALEIYPDDRYQSAEEMRQALSQPSQATTSFSIGSKTGRKRSALPLVTGIIGLALVLLTLTAVAVMLLGQTNSTARQQPQHPIAAVESPAGPTSTATPTSPPAATVTPTKVMQAAEEFPAVETTPTPLPPTPTPTASPTPTRQVTQPKGIQAASLTGTIAYPVFNGSNYDIYFGKADGSGTQFFMANASQPAFSPDGARIAFHSWSLQNRGLMTTNTSGGNPLLVATFIEDQLPTWSADGKQITLLSRRSGTRKSELIRINSFEERGDGDLVGEGEYPTIGQTGRLVFKGWGRSGTGLRLGTTALDDLQNVTNSEKDTAPALSPDGQTIAFMSQRDGNWEIYVVNTDGSNLQRLTNNTAPDGLPTWSPDGNVLAFVSEREGQWAMWATTLNGQDQRQLFKMQGSPDGFVGNDTFASRGWAEERISWTR